MKPHSMLRRPSAVCEVCGRSTSEAVHSRCYTRLPHRDAGHNRHKLEPYSRQAARQELVKKLNEE